MKCEYSINYDRYIDFVTHESNCQANICALLNKRDGFYDYNQFYRVFDGIVYIFLYLNHKDSITDFIALI